MCVYISANERPLQLDYVAESIELFNNSMEENIVDILLTNHSTEPIDKIFVLYPHPWPYKGQDEFYGLIKDTTETFGKDCVYNKLYNAPGSSLIIETERDGSASKMIISQPDPNDPIKDRRIEGFIRGRHSLKPWDIGVEEWDILTDMGWAVFVCEFSQPIECKEARWMRWQIKPGYPTNWNKMPLWQRIYRIMLNSLTYHYEVFGPYDVHHRFWEGLLSYQRECLPSHAKHEANITHTTNLIVEAKKAIGQSHGYSPLQPTETPAPLTIKDWRVHIFPPHRFKILPPSKAGDIRVCGAGANQLKLTDGEYSLCYQWVAGENNLEQPNRGLFNIIMDVEYVSLIPRAIPWIALVLSLLNLFSRLAIK